ncbi:MAG: hypothetical protein JNG86_21810 [Verrucomicrobiaceae bacterium]|nr:hypothetical protein [Verrucomicrobiaceae bacterium]
MSSLLPHVPGVRCVSSFDELISTRFGGSVNALCWPRVIAGDFSEVVGHLDVARGITHLDADELRGLPLSEMGRAAVHAMLGDLESLREHGLEPSLDCINGYTHPVEPPHLRTDVCSWHVDSATVEADTWLCTYHGASSEGVPNEQAIRRIDDPERRGMLRAVYGGADDESFEEWLSDHFHDLHYHPLPGAVPYSFGLFYLWRVATLYPGSPVPPCIHRAPDPVPGQKRLLLIS